MVEIRHFLDGQNLGLPRNWRDIEISIDWTNEQNETSINTQTLSFVGEAKNYIVNHILNGEANGVGIFEGLPYRIEIGDLQNPSFVFDGYLDLTSETLVMGKEEISVGLKKRQGRDWLNETAESFSFAYLYDQGEISDGDFVKVPYVINYVPDAVEIALIQLSIFMVTKELIENVKTVAEAIGDATNAATPGTGQGFGGNAGGPVVTFNINQDLGDIILLAIKIAAQIAYVIAITVGLINLVESLFEQLLPKRREHLGMTFKRMLEITCSRLNLTLQTDIQELEWVHIPRKDRRGGENGEVGFPQNGGSLYTPADLIRTLMNLFNANYQINNGVFIFKRRDKFRINGNFQLPGFLNNQDRLLHEFRYNTDEILSNYNIIWAYDPQDQNTLDNLEGMIYQVVTQPVTKTNEDLVNVKNLGEVNLPFSLGRRKNNLTNVEEIAKVLGGLVDEITGIFGSGTNFRGKIESRVGSLLLSSHFLTTGKVVKMNGAKLATNQRQLLSAKNLWDKFHFINSFAPINGEHNQYIVFPETPTTISKYQFETLLENNTGTDLEGNEFEVEKVTYLPHEGKGLISYRVKKLYTNNLKVELIE